MLRVSTRAALRRQAGVVRRSLRGLSEKAAGEGEKAAAQSGGGGGGGLGMLALAAAAGAGGYFYYTTQMGGGSGWSGKVDYQKVKKDIAEALEDETHDDGSYGPILVRLAWHSSGTWDEKTQTGGSDGAGMRYDPEAKWGANAGLHKARARLEQVNAANPGISYADLWILAGNTAIEEMGGPTLPFRPGRRDKPSDAAPLPDGRLPDADGRDTTPEQHLRDIFYKMGFNDQEIVALSGAHALGRCHTDASGYWGPWTFAPTTFSNEYFRLLLNEKWTKKKTHEGKKWEGPEQFEDSTKQLMMLPTDMCLIKDKEFKKHVERYAKDEQAFFEDFKKAWIKLTENGCKNLEPQPVA